MFSPTTHHECPLLHAGDTLAELAGGADGDREPRCRTCYDRLHYFELGIGAAELIPDTPDIAAYKAARRAGGESDTSGLPQGYSLNVPNGLEYLRYPCDCVPDSSAQVVLDPSGLRRDRATR